MKKYSNVKKIYATDYSNDLLKSLSNFCSKSPINVEINYVKDMNKIYLNYENKTYTIDIDPLINKKLVIGNVKKELEKYYPYLYEMEKTIPSSEEIETLMKQGLTLKEALSNVYEDEVPKFKIIRKHDKFNEIDVLNLKDKCLYKYKTRIPVSVLIERSKYKDCSLLNDIQLMYKLEKKEQ